MPRPNILFVFTDDQRFDTINALGNTEIKTPNIDQLVERGTTYTHAHIPCGTSGAVCMPSRAMLHSGRSLFHIEGAGQSIPTDHKTLGETLKGAGYNSFMSGKWHNGTEAFNRSFTDGRGVMFGGMADHWNVPLYDYDATGVYGSKLPICTDAFHSNKVAMRSCDRIESGKHSSEIVSDTISEFLRSQSSETPFFAYASFLAPHDPRTMPEKFLKMYDPEAIELPPNFSGGHPFDNGALHIRDEMLAAFPRDIDETKKHLAEYYGMITHLDDCLGRIITTLKEKNLFDNTIVVFAGDNGLAVGQHGLFGKQSCYEHSVRVPLIFAGPNIPAGETRDTYTYLFDIFPTLCDLCDVEIPESVEGKSLMASIGDDSVAHRQTLYFAYCEFQRAVKDSRYKLIEYAVPNKEGKISRMTQLFDLQLDPWEMNNLAEADTHAEKVTELRAELIRLRDDWDDLKSPFGEKFWGKGQS